MIVVSNATPIISLTKAGILDLLGSLYEEILIPQAVYDELTTNNTFSHEVNTIKECKFLTVRKVGNEFAVKLLQKQLNLDLGESESIVLAESIHSDLLIIDEKKARRIAKEMGLKITGTLGFLVELKSRGKVNLIKPILDAMLESGIRISVLLYKEILHKSGELESFE